MISRDNVLIIAPELDIHARVVVDCVRGQGGHALILDPVRFGADWSLSTAIGPQGLSFTVDGPSGALHSEAVSGVWWRRPAGVAADPAVTDESHAEFCRRQMATALAGAMVAFGDRVINPVRAQRAAMFKPVQLARAVAVGLATPKTLITNDPDRLRGFAKATAGRLVYKPLVQPEGGFLDTRPLDDALLEDADAIRLGPLIFQERVEKVADLRVTVIDNETFTVACKPRTAGAELDWRLDPACDYVPADLPADVGEMIVALHKDLGLRYGAVDLAVDGDGRHIFLETNVGGQFLFMDSIAGLPVAEAMAQALLRGPIGADAAGAVSRAATSPACGV